MTENIPCKYCGNETEFADVGIYDEDDCIHVSVETEYSCKKCF